MVRIKNGPDYRQLESRSGLEFHYPDSSIVTIPFFQNPTISEKSSASLVTYNPLARAGSLFAYTGSKERSFSLEMTMTLPHLTYYDMGIQKYNRAFLARSPEQSKDLFFVGNNNYITKNDSGSSIAYEAKKLYDSLVGDTEPLVDTNNFVVSLETIQKQEPTEFLKTVDTLVFFLAIVRTSIMNNVNNPLQGPPLVRLNFGTLFRDVPCVVKNYSISWDEAGGYDVETITPRMLKINLELLEVRLGDLAKFDHTDIVKRDNLTGWESVLANPWGIDPGREALN